MDETTMEVGGLPQMAGGGVCTWGAANRVSVRYMTDV
jgi:hypothetical protein